MNKEREINLGTIELPYKDSFEVDLTKFGLENSIVYAISGCGCIEVAKNTFIAENGKINYKVKSKSDLVVINEKSIYLYTLIGEVRNYFETIKIIYK